MFNISQQLVLVYYSWHYFYTDFFPVSALHGPSCGLDRIRIVNILRIESIIKYFFFNKTWKNNLPNSENLVSAI